MTGSRTRTKTELSSRFGNVNHLSFVRSDGTEDRSSDSAKAETRHFPTPVENSGLID
jgi:hypothetical protein